jgi:hypothetical protein
MTVYFPADQFFFFQPELIVQTSPDAGAAMTHVREAIQSVVRGAIASLIGSVLFEVNPLDAGALRPAWPCSS